MPLKKVKGKEEKVEEIDPTPEEVTIEIKNNKGNVANIKIQEEPDGKSIGISFDYDGKEPESLDGTIVGFCSIVLHKGLTNQKK